MDVIIEHSWKDALKDEFKKPYFLELLSTLQNMYARGTIIYPSTPYIFNAFNLCSFTDAKVILIGQDPYHGSGQAHGLSFSVQDDMRIPPSLKNIYTEIYHDIGTPIPNTGDLTQWAKQGILLLNATLTVEARKAGSHQGLGWELFTDAVIQKISDTKKHCVFLLWGKYAQEKEYLIDTTKHYILKAPHPSPFSVHSGFFGCTHFSKTNSYLEKTNQKPIIW